MYSNCIEEEHDYICKIVLVGESSVGKTNILSRLCKNEFNTESTSTIGVEFASKVLTVDNKKIRLQIWDTAGQEKFKSITNAYYKNAKGALVVYDITKASTFEAVEKWVKELRNIGGNDVVITLVGNKTDLKHMRSVNKEDGMEKAEKLGLAYIETSALNNSCIEDAFNFLITSNISLLRII